MRPSHFVHKENIVFQSSNLFPGCLVEPNQSIQTAGPFFQDVSASMDSECLLEAMKVEGKEHGLDGLENDVLGCLE